MATIVKEVRLIWSESAMSNEEVDHNKFWNGTLFDNGDVSVEYGRVGASKPQGKTHFGAGAGKLDALERSKLKKGYVAQRTISGTGGGGGSSASVKTGDLETQALQDIGGSSEVQSLVSFLVKSNIHQITANTQITYNKQSGQFETPLGLVTASAITEARGLLNSMAKWVVDKKWDNSTFRSQLNEYMQIIPTDVGMKRGWHRTIFAGNNALVKQNDILDSLDASLLTAKTPVKGKKKTKTSSDKVFEVKLELITNRATTSRVKSFFKSTKGNHYDVKTLDIKRIYAVHIPTIRAAYEKEKAKIGGVMELWHGTKASNLLSILKIGLLIPPTSSGHVTGRMFGDGLYFSDQSTKSLRYATNAWGGGGNTQRTFMFLADVAMGKSHTPRSWGLSRPPSGFDSVFAKGGVSGVANNEMIVYRVSQADLAYLIEFTPYGK